MRIDINLNCRKAKDDYLKNLMRDNTQLLINKIWEVRLNPNT